MTIIRESSRRAAPLEARREAARKVLRLWPGMVVPDAWCSWALYRAICHGEAYVGPLGGREWRTVAEAPFGFSFSVVMDILGLAVFFILPLIVLWDYVRLGVRLAGSARE